MKRILILLALLLIAGQAQAASFGYGTPGGSTTDLVATPSLANRGGSTTSLRRGSAVVGDRLDSIRVYCDADDGLDSIIVALYYGASSPSQLLFADTIAAPSAAGWATTGSLVSVNFRFVDGLTYFITTGYYDDPDVLVHFDAALTGDGETNVAPISNPWTGGATNTNKYSIECFYTAMTYQWGGPSLKTAANMRATWNKYDEVDTHDTLNYGSDVSLSFRVGTGGANNRSVLIRPTSDLTTSGFIQDSLRIYFAVSTMLGGSDDSIRFGAYALNKTWGEGDNSGTRADAGEASWDSSETGTVAWASQVGGTNSTDRTPTTVAGFRWYTRANSLNDTIADIWYSYISIPASHITSSFDNCGYVVWADDARNLASININWDADDNATAARRPYMVGWEHASTDTCSVDHSTSAIDTNISTIVVRNDYTDNATTIDSISLIWDDDTNPAAPLGRVDVTSGITDPDTLTASGLTQCVTYYLWFIIEPAGCIPDTSAMMTIPTLCPTTRRTVIGAGG